MKGSLTACGGGSSPDAGELPDSLIDAAIGWAVRLNYSQPTAKDQHDFEQWLRSDPLHGVAWQRMNDLKGFKSDLGALPPALARDALNAAQALRDGRANSRRAALKLFSLLGIAVATGWLAREHLPWQRVLADASTGVGEQKTLRLDDGSVIVLNTDSAIGIDLSGGSRLIALRRGEILVTTGPDVEAAARLGGKRPFWVSTPFGRMQALGTRFTVRLDEERARISVQEGAVALHPAGGGTSVVVPAGQSRWLLAGGTQPAESQGFGADDWAEGVIAGKNIRLQDLLAEMERYRPGRIVCDPRVAELRLSGTFHVNDTDRALQFLMQTQPVSVTYRTRWWVMVGPDERR
jgi:transmembrane sensor